MTAIGEQLSVLLRRQLEERGVVVWYDPECQYSGVVANLDRGGAELLQYEDSFFVLRRALDPFLAGENAQPVLVYVPLDPAATANALVEAEIAGVTMRPGAPSLPRNTRLSVLARAAANATGRWTDQAADKVARDIDAGLYVDAAEIDRLIEGGDSVLQLIFKSADPQAVALLFLADETIDPEITSKRALPELQQHLHRALGITSEADKSPADFRARLSRYVLLTELMAELKESPASLAGAAAAPEGNQRGACVAVARAWRNRSDLRAAYVTTATGVEHALGLQALELPIQELFSLETFAYLERLMQEATEQELVDEPSLDLVARARARQSSFWSEITPDTQARWALIAAAGEVLVEADRVEAGLRGAAGDAGVILHAYAEAEYPWCLLDTAYRNLERLYQTLDIDLAPQRGLEALVVRARQRYSTVTASLAEEFLRGFRDAGFKLPGVLRQTGVFVGHVAPHLKTTKIAYLLVDALRFEMARELAAAVGEDFKATLTPALAAIPTMTEIGMAALLPGAEDGVEVTSVGSGRLGLKVGGEVLADRAARVAHIAKRLGNLPVVTLDDLLPSPKKALRDTIADAQLVVVTSQEIDQLCEGDNVSLARQLMDTLLHRLLRGCRVLRDLGVEAIVVVADHGFLFGEELGSDMKIDAPGGQTADLHRRVWVGKGGAADAACMRAPLAALGMGSDLDVCVPWSLAAFKVKGGARAYFHGGMSLQELVVPVLALRPRVKAQPVTGDITWDLALGSAKISTRFISVQVMGRAAGLFDPVAPKVRVEIKAGGKVISKAVSASYGFEEATGNVQLKLAESPAGEPRHLEAETVALMITGETTAATATVVLIDALTGVELAKQEGIELAIAI